MCSDREMAAEAIGYHLGSENAMLCLTKSISASRYCEVPPPQKKNGNLCTLKFKGFPCIINDGKAELFVAEFVNKLVILHGLGITGP